jgi:hypothetical protein
VAETFTGFPPSGIDFLAGLAADNTKAYFDRDRSAYAHALGVTAQMAGRPRHDLTPAEFRDGEDRTSP